LRFLVTALLLIPAVLPAAGCSTTTHGLADSQATRTWLTEHAYRNAMITLRDEHRGAELRGALFDLRAVPSDSPLAEIQITSGGDNLVVPIDHIRQVKVRNRARGALEGTLIGAGSGVLLGVAAVAVAIAVTGKTHAQSDFMDSGPGDRMFTLGAIGAIFGAAIGSLTGLILGHSDTLRF